MQIESTIERASPGVGPVFIVAGLLVLWLLSALNSPPIATASAVALGAVVLLWAAWHVQRDGAQLLCAAVLIELLSSTTLVLNEDQGYLIRYPLLLVFCVPVAIRSLREPLLRRGGFRDYLFYLGWAGISVTYSLVPMYSLARFAAASVLFVVLFSVVRQVSGLKDVQRLFRWYAIGAGVVCIGLAGSLFVLPHEVVWDVDEITGMERFAGFFGSPNSVGEVTLAVVGIAPIVWIAASRWEKALIAVEVVIAIVLGAMADSRSPFVSLAIGGLAYLFWRYRMRALPICLLAAVLAFPVIRHVDPEYVTRGNVSTLTGRTDVWAFSVQKLKERPLIGWGYEVEGEIFNSKYFPMWWGPWDLGPRSSLHNGYLARAVGLGVPAFIFWVFIFVRPWVSVFKRKTDEWQLKQVFLLVVLPVLVLNMVESTAADCRYAAGLITTLCWALAERQRLEASDQLQTKPGLRAGFLAAVRG